MKPVISSGAVSAGVAILETPADLLFAMSTLFIVNVYSVPSVKPVISLVVVPLVISTGCISPSIGVQEIETLAKSAFVGFVHANSTDPPSDAAEAVTVTSSGAVLSEVAVAVNPVDLLPTVSTLFIVNV